MLRTRKGGGQADLRRGETGTSPQHRIKSSIRHMVELRISDNRALKVAEEYPGRPVASQNFYCCKLPEEGNRLNKFPGVGGTPYPSYRRAASFKAEHEQADMAAVEL